MKLQLSILLVLALIICDLVVAAESEKTAEMVGRKKFNRQNKMIRKPDAAQRGEKRSRFPRRQSSRNPAHINNSQRHGIRVGK